MIYLLRHGQTDWNVQRKIQGHTNLALNENGRRQALALSSEMDKFQFDVILTSDLIRAKETADILNKHTQIKVFTDTRLREINLGSLEGQPIQYLTSEVWAELSKDDNCYQAETLKRTYDRVKDFFEQLNFEQNVLIVTHSGLLKVMAYYRFYPDEFDYGKFAEKFKDLWIPNTQIISWNTLGQ